MEERTVEQIIASAAAAARTALSEIESKQLLQALGVAVTIPQAALNADEAAAAAARIGLPVVLKVLSPEVSHKSEVGGVALGLSSEREVRDAFARIRTSLAERAPGARFDGVAVDRMARPGVELILGIIRDERFGPLVIAGLGGIFVEVFADTAFRLAPIDRREARAMLDELRGGAILRGVRGARPIAFDAVADLLVKLSEFAATHPDVKEMDLNPVVAYDDGLAVLDALVLLGGAPGAVSADPHKAARLGAAAQFSTARRLSAQALGAAPGRRPNSAGKASQLHIETKILPPGWAFVATLYCPRSVLFRPQPSGDSACRMSVGCSKFAAVD